jgi:hypothetical protein
MFLEVDVTRALAALLANDGGVAPTDPDRLRSEYGVVATMQESDLVVVLTFRSGTAYCCMEWGCHLPLFDERRWARARAVLVGQGISVPPRMRLRLKCVVEEGALFFDYSKPLPGRRGWYEFKAHKAAEYEVETTESCDG